MFMESPALNHRDETFDIIKGVCILLMVVGHCDLPIVLHKIIYSFHMPIFFIVAGYFAREQSLKRNVLSGIRRLIIPYLMVYAICYIFTFFLRDIVSNNNFFVFVLAENDSSNILPMFDCQRFPVWFLVALFWCRVAFDFILRIKNDVFKLILCILVPLLAVNLYVYVKMPFSFLTGLSAVGFYAMGSFLKRMNFQENKRIWKNFPVFLSAWFVCFFSTGTLAIWRNAYNGFYILDCLGALAIFLILYIVVEKGKTDNRMWNFLKWCGVNSLIILCVHAIEFGLINYPFEKTLLTQYFLWYSVYVVILLRLIFDIALAFLLSKSFIVRKYIFAQE